MKGENHMLLEGKWALSSPIECSCQDMADPYVGCSVLGLTGDLKGINEKSKKIFRTKEPVEPAPPNTMGTLRPGNMPWGIY